jgi:hypothetical protein
MTIHPDELDGLKGHPAGRVTGEMHEGEAGEERYGMLAEFTDEESLLDAVRAARGAGYTRLDAFTPYPVEGLAELLTPRVDVRNRRDRDRLRQAIARRDVRGIADWLGGFNVIALLTLGGAIAGGIVGYGLQLWGMTLWYPYLNVGGRPYNSWPYYLPITYELVILFAALTAIIGMIILNGLPQPYHPVFNVPEFARASQSRFFLLIEADDPRFSADGRAQGPTESVRSTRQFLETLAPGRVYDAAS